VSLGLIARADDRGIGTMTWEFAKAMRPDHTLVVREPGAEAKGFAPHLDRYPGAFVVTYDIDAGTLEPWSTVREFLQHCDVAYMVETPYDWRLFDLARKVHCATVLHVMPEFWRWQHADTPRPDVWWIPTTWLADRLPDECRLIPVPVPTLPQIYATPPTRGLVHVAGHRAGMDRNGTTTVLSAMRLARSVSSLRVECQDPRLPATSDPRVTLRTGGRPDRWSMYDDAAALVMPRRYGGLCLPALEAMARGLAVVMPDLEPQRSTWPVVVTKVRRVRTMDAPGGPIPIADVDARDLGQVLDHLERDEFAMIERQERARAWALANNWAALADVYRSELAAVLACRP
jgi:hypothetical protein